MTLYIAFLRAINVGGHTVRMEQLRRLFEALEYTNVETFIASGNVIFESPGTDARALEQQIERQLQASLGYAVATFIRSAAELAAVGRYLPFAPAELAAEANSLYVAFVKEPPTDGAQQKLMAFRTTIDEFHVHEREVYWLCRKKMSESTFSGALLEKAIGMPATMRNITTVKKLAVKYPAAE
ncbi:MAG TPA: DUF1697 domain-containing protein [Roseiflexaceae bacterium]|nr:DUF1697 domain-containing protein [Roseiflexaceae bacterium]